MEWEKRCLGLKGTCTQYFLEGKTTDRATNFKDGSIVWLFIDACHCFECVSKEIELYTPKIAAGGYILFHDTAMQQHEQWVTHNPPRRYGVTKAIAKSIELKNQFTFVHESRSRNGTQIWKKNV